MVLDVTPEKNVEENVIANTSSPGQATRRIRVLQLINGLPVGGAEQLLVTLARYIDRTRFDLRVCTLTPLDDSPIERDLRALGVPIYSLGDAGLINPRNPIRLAGLLRRHAIDVVHTHLNHSDTIGGIAGFVTRRPVVSTLHLGVYEPEPPFSAAKQMLHTAVLRRCMRTVIGCAPEICTDVVKKLKVPADKMRDVPNGIDVDAFAHVEASAVAARRREFLDGDGPLVVTVGNLKAAKGHEYLVAATALLARRFPGLKVVIVGRPMDNEGVVRERIAAVGLQGRVILAGQRRDVAEIVASSDLFVLSSLLEGLPLALLEAMAAGKPVVATAVDGVPGVVEDGVTGRLVPAADAEALASAMEEALSQPDLAAQLSARGRTFVATRFGADTWARSLERIYNDAVARR